MCGIVGYVGGARRGAASSSTACGGSSTAATTRPGSPSCSEGALERRRAAGKLENLAESLAREPLVGRVGRRPHPLGHPRPAHRGERPPAPGRRRADRRGPQRHHRELPRARRRGCRPRATASSPQTDTEVVAHLVGVALPGARSRTRCARRSRELEGSTRSCCSTGTSRGCWWRRAWARRSWSGSARARTSSPPTSRRSCRTPATFALPRGRRRGDGHARGRADHDARRRARRRARRSASPGTRCRPRRAATATSCSRRSTSSRGRCATRCSAGSASTRARSTSRSSGPRPSGCAASTRVVLLACGTSWHAALVGKFLIEQLARHPGRGRLRQRVPLPRRRSWARTRVAVAISQSGETADTLAAFREAQARGRLPLAICNVQGSMLTREAAGSLLTHAGPEIGVASTKAFTAQLVALCSAGPAPRPAARARSAPRPAASTSPSLTRIPHLMEQALEREEPRSRSSRATLARRADFLYLGRGINYPIALEGALKLKEISYVHAEGYPAGEMKHGPIALIDERPAGGGARARAGRVYEKMLSNVQEVKARGGRVIAVGSRRRRARCGRSSSRRATRCSRCPPCPELLVAVPDRAPAAAPRLPRGACGPGATWTSRATSPSPSPSSRRAGSMTQSSPSSPGSTRSSARPSLAVEGPVLILAGAGSGKTRVITHRIAHLVLDQGVAVEPHPGRHLHQQGGRGDAAARRGAAARPGAPAPGSRTFHSFCVRLLRREAAAAGLAARLPHLRRGRPARRGARGAAGPRPLGEAAPAAARSSRASPRARTRRAPSEDDDGSGADLDARG